MIEPEKERNKESKRNIDERARREKYSSRSRIIIMKKILIKESWPEVKR